MTSNVSERIAELRTIADKGHTIAVPLDEIVFDAPDWVEKRNNVRKEVARDTRFLELVADIQANGIKQNISLRLCVSPEETSYCLICVAGQRRVLASREAIPNLRAKGTAQDIERAVNLSKIPATITLYADDESALADSLAENLLRADLHLVDLALGFKFLFQKRIAEGQTKKEAQADIAQRFGKKPETIRIYIKIGYFPDKALECFRKYPKIFNVNRVFQHIAGNRFFDDDQIIDAVESYLNKSLAAAITPLIATESTEEKPEETSPLESDELLLTGTDSTKEKPKEISPLGFDELPQHLSKKDCLKELNKLLKRLALPNKTRIKGNPEKGALVMNWQSIKELKTLTEWLKRTSDAA